MTGYFNGYGYGMQNPYYLNNMYNPHPSYFANAMQQNYGNQSQIQQQQQTQQTQNNPSQNQQNITTQPPILQPINSKIVPVSNRDEATAAQIDLIYGTPSFFYNKGKNEIYLKQFDVQNGTAIFKTYGELEPIEEEIMPSKNNLGVNLYQEEFKRLNEGINSLHRMIAKLQEKQNENEYEDVIDIEPEVIEIKPKGNKKHV